jgi:hypothetical protein
MDELWKSIDGYPAYEVSDLGRVRRTHDNSGRLRSAPRLLKQPLRTGYPCVDLCRDGESRTFHVHRLVAGAFVPHADGDCDEVNHIDGGRTNNHAVNLEWVTRQGNQLHAYRAGLQVASGERNGYAKLTAADVAAVKRLLLETPRRPYVSIGNIFGVTEGTIRAIAHGRTWASVLPAEA